MARSSQVDKKAELRARAKKFVLESFNTYKNRSGLEERWNKNERIFNMLSVERYYKGAANLFPPETRAACKSLTDFAEEALFSTNDYFRVKGTGGQSDNDRAAVLKSLIETINHKISYRRKVRDLLESLPIRGMAIVKVPHKIKQKYILDSLAERKKLKAKLNGEKLKKDVIKKLATLYDNIDFEPKELTSMYWDYYTPWEDQECIIERQEVTESYLRMMEKTEVFSGVQEIFKETAGTDQKTTNDESKTYVNSYIADLTGLTVDGYKTNKKRYELLEAWCNFDIDDDGIDEECVVVIIDRKHVVRLELNPYDLQEKPYLWVPWEHVKGTSIGIGVPQICEKDQIALNDFVNQIMDNITAILNNMWIVDSLAEIPKGQLKSRPHGIIESKAGTGAVQPVRPPLTANEGLKAVAMAKEHIRQSSGATANFQGMPARYDTSATEASQMSNSSARDVFSKLRDIEDRVLVPYYQRAYSYSLQFMSRKEFIKLVGIDAARAVLKNDMSSDSDEALKKALLGDYDFVALGVTQMENKVVKLQQLINFYNVVAASPQSQGVVDFPKLITKIWKYAGDGDSIMLPQQDANLISPDDENVLMAQGEAVPVNLMENHEQHIQKHLTANIPQEYEYLRKDQISAHLQAMQALSMMRGQGKAPVQPQNQPRLAPDPMTEATAVKMTGMPVEAEGMML